MRVAALVVTGALAAAGLGLSQSNTAIGTVAAVRAEAGELVVKRDSNEPPMTARVNEETIIQRVAPGEKDLKKAEATTLSGIANGDRVLVTLMPGSAATFGLARRVIVMPATAIAKRNEDDRLDWERRGVFGVVTARNDHEIHLRQRAMQGNSEAVVTTSPTTAFKRYAPDSVKFADAKSSSLDEVRPGDQLRARGTKSADGLTVTADEVVFGTFVTVTGSITGIDAQTKEIVVQDTATGKKVTIVLTADSQLKTMPELGAMPMPEPASPPTGGVREIPERRWAGAPPGARPNFSSLLDRLPAATIEDLKAGETIVVSSSKGSRDDHLTAITLIGNAGMLVRMASMRNARNERGDSLGMGSSLGMLTTGTSGNLELPGMIP